MFELNWQTYSSQIHTFLNDLEVSDANGIGISADLAFSQWLKKCYSLRVAEGEIFFIGNGASASLASHFAADILKNGRIRTHLFTDLTLLTALANDEGYEQSFSLPLAWTMRRGDMLVAISSSGASPNILSAVEAAWQKGGYVVTLSSFRRDNPLRYAGHLNFYIPAPTYGLAESCHAALLHYWTDKMTSIGIQEGA